MKYHKSIVKKVCILLLILILETMNLPLMSINTAAVELNGNSDRAYNALNVEKIAYSAQDLNSIIKNQLAQRETSFNIRYKADITNLKSIIETEIYGIFKADDYLKSCIKSYQCSYRGYENDVTINFDFSFYTTKIQEDYVNSQVTIILKDIIKVSMNDDQKEKVIHDYIVSHVAYDTTISKFTAYEALKNGTTVCSGYAQLAYKMLNEVGIETKIVLGKGNGEDHAWNLVKLHDAWYHLDCTWDDPLPDIKGRVLYNYYNLNDKKISEDHTFVKSDYLAATQIYNARLPIFDEKEFVQWAKVDSNAAVISTKEWNINFNKEIDELSLKDKIFICRQGENSNFPIKLQLSGDKKTVKILHNTPFELGQNYTLYISKDISGLYNDKNLKTSMKMSFKISN
ncbi:MAG: transglutaminase domain-containing protein [Clostridium sp.]|uniref:transglutaminase domain-containing protein n=1 Tax=Clostridium sp. TaxID=1506 RepID=UPI003D6CF584